MARWGRVLAGAAALGMTLWGCSDATAPSGDGNGDGNGNPVQREISVLGFAPAPSRLVVRDDALYWLDASEVPLNRLSLTDGGFTPYPAFPIPEFAVSDGQDVYWVSANRLYRTSLDGTATTLLQEGERDRGVTAAIVMDQTHVYWANSVPGGACSPACTFEIIQVPKSGGAPTTLTTTSQTVVALAIAGGHLFWEEQRSGPVNADGSIGSAIRKVSIVDGTVTGLVDGRLNGIIPPPSPGFIPASWHPRGGIATDGATVYFADADFVDSYRVMSVSAEGGDVAIMADITTGDLSNFARDLELDADNVYWVDLNSLKALPKGGGAHTELAGSLVSPVSPAYEAGRLFWLETECCAHGQKGTIRTMAAGGGNPATLKDGIDAPVNISVDMSNVYWVEGGSIGETERFGRIARVAHDGAAETILVESAEGGPFTVDDTHLYFANGFTIKRVPISGGAVERLAIGGSYVADLSTDGTHVYWIQDPTSAISKVSVNGGGITNLAGGRGPAGVIRLDATHVYWLDHDDVIKRIPKEGGTPATVVGPVPGFVTDFVVDGVNVYFSEWDGGRIRKVARSGGDVSVLAFPGIDQTRRLATDGLSVYWIDQLQLGKVPVGGGELELIVGGIASSPFGASGVAVDATSVYWTEIAGNVLKMATPK
jgi:hypothetical protein